MGRSRVATGVIAVWVFGAMAAAGCSSAPRRPERKLAVDETINQVIVPGVEHAAQAAWRFADAMDGWCDDPVSADRRRAMADGLDELAVAWAATAGYSIGPAVERRSGDSVAPALAELRATLAEVDGADAADVCPAVADAVATIEDETAAIERAWNAGPEGGLPYRSTAAGIGDGALSNEEMIAALRDVQRAAIAADREVVERWSTVVPVDPDAWWRAAGARVGGVADAVDVLAHLAEPAVERRQRAAATAAVDAVAEVDPATGAGVDVAAVALRRLDGALAAGSPGASN